MEIQDLNVGVFQNGMVRVMDEIARGTAQTQGYSSRKCLRSWVCACYHMYFRSILLTL